MDLKLFFYKMLVNMSVLCVFLFACLWSGANGSLADQMAEATELCCNQGSNFARNHSIEECSSSVPPDVPAPASSICILVMDQCCKDYYQKRKDCDTGIVLVAAGKNCESTSSTETMRACCEKCLDGHKSGSEHGEGGCIHQVSGQNAEDLLAVDAFSQCCSKATKDNPTESQHPRSLQHLPQPVTLNRNVETAASLCEDYAPTELCAHHCIPVPGSYKCECNPGYMLMADKRNCKEISKNRCKPRNPCHHKCIDNGVEVKCSCKRGYQLMSDGKSCEDINECLLAPPVCLEGTDCHNVQGSYKCMPTKRKTRPDKGACPPGFTRNLLNNVCDDINECLLPNPPCAAYLCENSIGGYSCGGVRGDPANLPQSPSIHKPTLLQPSRTMDERCPPGFRTGINEECEDVDECQIRTDDCNRQSQFCINTRGSFHCQDQGSKHCPPGFKINTHTGRCEDINECEDGQDICKINQICINVLGEYDCRPVDEAVNRMRVCPDGMRLIPGTGTCQDVNECLEGTHLCDQHQNCLNTNGSHECHCRVGFKLDPTTGACVDINECATMQHNCLAKSQRCDNTVGSFICVRFISCGTGYILHHSKSECEDVDECALGTDNCAQAGPAFHCENMPGSFRCLRTEPSTTLLPESEYEYYDTDDEEEVNKQNDTSTTTTTTTTSAPLPEPTEEITPYKPPSSPSPNPYEDHDLFKRPEYPRQPPQVPQIFPDTVKEPLKPTRPEYPKPEEPIESDLARPYVSTEPRKPTPKRPMEPTQDYPLPERRPTEDQNIPNIDERSQTPEASKSPSTISSTYYFEPRESSSEPSTKEEDEESNTIDSNRGSDLPDTSLSSSTPQNKAINNIYINPDVDTAVVTGEKEPDGSVVVDTGIIPENKWTKIKPSPCQKGFELDEFGACLDTDECSTGHHTCSGLTETCRNTMGGYLCDCATSFQRDLYSGACVLVSSSSISTSTSTSTVTPTTSSTLPPTVVYTTPKPKKPHTFWGYPEYPQRNLRPFLPRSMCDIGFNYNTRTSKCDDINECENGEANCAAEEICVNSVGGYKCECQPNWKLDDVRQRCVPPRSQDGLPPGYENRPVYPPTEKDVEQDNMVITPQHSQVSNGAQVIKCPWGYRMGDDGNCIDIDECLSGEAQCGSQQLCSNLAGGYTCRCPAGHELTSDHQCRDVDECAAAGDVPLCSHNADCINTVGSYHCSCHAGFRPAPVNNKVCVDVDECAVPGAKLCQQKCNNLWGGYRCSCHKGYRLTSDNRTCADVDECSEFKNKIICVGRCLNEPGSYRCTCPSGYRLSEDKKSCIDINECETGEAPCSSATSYNGTSDVCLNTRGGYRCFTITCPAGYKLESRHRCTKIDRVCRPGDHECAHQPTTYSYNYITFVSKLYIPAAKVDLFTMRGPAWPHARMKFELRLLHSTSPPHVKKKADANSFLLVQTANQAVMSLVESLEGPQSIELELSMNLYSGEQFGGTAVAKLFIYVSEYEF